MELILLPILAWILIGWICSGMAQKRGRSVVKGWWAGILFGVFAIIYYAIAGDAPKPVSAGSAAHRSEGGE